MRKGSECYTDFNNFLYVAQLETQAKILPEAFHSVGSKCLKCLKESAPVLHILDNQILDTYFFI